MLATLPTWQWQSWDYIVSWNSFPIIILYLPTLPLPPPSFSSFLPFTLSFYFFFTFFPLSLPLLLGLWFLCPSQGGEKNCLHPWNFINKKVKLMITMQSEFDCLYYIIICTLKNCRYNLKWLSELRAAGMSPIYHGSLKNFGWSKV